MTCGDIFLGLIAIIFPPIAVWIKSGLCSADSLINILLCILGFLPGLLHAWYIIAKYPEYDYEAVSDDEEANHGGARVTYYYVSHESRPQRQQQHQNYGTQDNAPPVPKGNRPVPAATVAGPSSGAGGNEPSAPPSYADAVKGDHKVQQQE